MQNLQSFRWEEDYVNDMLERTMRHAFDEVWALAEEKRASLRMGAYMSALKRVVGAKKLRGIFPRDRAKLRPAHPAGRSER